MKAIKTESHLKSNKRNFCEIYCHDVNIRKELTKCGLKRQLHWRKDEKLNLVVFVYKIAFQVVFKY